MLLEAGPHRRVLIFLAKGPEAVLDHLKIKMSKLSIQAND
jgi:hypothetical protein